jgi:hypothetical protein
MCDKVGRATGASAIYPVSFGWQDASVTTCDRVQ